MTGRYGGLLVAVLAFPGPFSPQAGEAGPPPPSAPAGAKAALSFHWIVDYLPAALYENEPLTACFRIENTTERDAKVELRAEVLDAADHVLRHDTEPCKAGAKGFASYRKDHSLRGARTVAFSLKTPQGVLRGPRVRVLREADPWPETAVRDGRLVERRGGAVLLPCVRKRITRENRAWAPLRWALKLDKKKPGSKIRRTLCFVPGAWEMRPAKAGGGGEAGRGGAAGARLFSERLAQALRALGPYPKDGVPPILWVARIADRLKAGGGAVPGRVVVVLLPPEDLEVATGPRLYKIALEFLLARLAASGVREVVLGAPFRFGVPEQRRKRLEQALRDAAQGYGARVLDLTECRDERLWRVEPNTKGVYGRRPNAQGLKKISRKLERWLP